MRIRKNVPLAPFTTFKVGGRAKYFAQPDSKSELIKALALARQKNLDVFILAGGSNLIFSDKGYRGLVIKPQLTAYKRAGNQIEAGASSLVEELVDYSVKQGLAGLEWAGGLPGTIGGAVRGNAGAFGSEIKDIIKAVESITYQGKTINRTAKQCRFAYRHSIFKQTKEIITGVTLALKPSAPERLALVARANREYRAKHHPLELPSAGSIFKNVPIEKIPPEQENSFQNKIKKDPFPVVPAAVIIARAGLSGERIGGAQVSPKHTNYIVNTGNATTRDIIKLIEKVKKIVYNKFAIELEIEPQIVKSEKGK